jgi:hypothetical protein
MPLIHSGENPIFADAVPNCGMTRCRDLLRLLSREPLFIGRGEEDSRLGQILVSLYTDAPMSATIIVQRKSAFVACARSVRIIVDQQEVGSVKNGKTFTHELPAGPHTIGVSLGMAQGPKSNIDLREGEACQLVCRPRIGVFAASSFELARADGMKLDENAAPAGHHGPLLLFLGFLSFLIGLLGVAVIGQGILDLGKMSRNRMDPSGRTLTIVSMFLGSLGLLVNVIGIYIYMTHLRYRVGF